MAIMVTAGEHHRDYVPAPEGTHHAVCCDVVDLGDLVDTYHPGKKKPVVNVVFEINEVIPGGTARFTVGKRYRRSLNEKAKLRADLESWRGRPFTRTEEQGFDLETIIGVNCLLNIQHKLSTDGTKTYANVMSVMPVMRGIPQIKVSPDYVRRQDRDAALAASPATPLAGPTVQGVTAAQPQNAPPAPPLAPLNLPQSPAGPIAADDIPF